MNGLPVHQHYIREGLAVDCHDPDCDVYRIQARQRDKETEHGGALHQCDCPDVEDY